MESNLLPTNVAVVGAKGKMGHVTLSCLSQMDHYNVVAEIDHNDDLATALQQTKPDVAIEFTSNLSAFNNSKTIIENGVRPIIGSSGLVTSDISHLENLCKQNKTGGMVIPNFSLGVACVNQAAKLLKQHYDDFSIIEYHHTKKKDKPSGTARHLSQILNTNEEDIASIRSDGYVAKMQLYVNSENERIIIDHESFDRNSFIPGIQLCLSKIMLLDHLVIGLENLI